MTLVFSEPVDKIKLYMFGEYFCVVTPNVFLPTHKIGVISIFFYP